MSVTQWVHWKSMIILWSILLVSAASYKVVDSNEDIGPEAFNVTTLYPVTSTKHQQHQHTENNFTDNNNNTLHETKDRNDKNDTKTKSQATVWKIDANFAETDKVNSTNITKEFVPSQHLGSIEEVHPTRATDDTFNTINKPADYVSPTKDYKTQYEIPKQFYETHKKYPYNYNFNSNNKDSWRHEDLSIWRPGVDSLESKPTAEVPVRIPAGGMYKYQDPFRDRPHSGEYGPEYNEGHKDYALHKRESPWEDVFRLLTAFIPVGIIISALSPSIITVQDTGFENGHTSNVFRRSDTDVSTLPVISERCRRRLLCELHSDNNYEPYGYTPPTRHRRHCYKIRCEDPEAIAATLKWLIEYKHK